MTLQAVEPTRVTIDPQRYVWCTAPELTRWCAMPGCTNTFRLQKHHIVRRTATGGPLDYVTIDGLVVQNVCMLCREHHEKITGSIGGHRLWIVYEDDEGWQVFEPGYNGRHSRFTKGNTPWMKVGPLRQGNHE